MHSPLNTSPLPAAATALLLFPELAALLADASGEGAVAASWVAAAVVVGSADGACAAGTAIASAAGVGCCSVDGSGTAGEEAAAVLPLEATA